MFSLVLIEEIFLQLCKIYPPIIQYYPQLEIEVKPPIGEIFAIDNLAKPQASTSSTCVPPGLEA